jgi:hypothetical protein
VRTRCRRSRRVCPALRDDRPRRLATADAAVALPSADGRKSAQHGFRDRRRQFGVPAVRSASPIPTARPSSQACMVRPRLGLRRGAHNRNRRGLRESDRAGSRTMPAATSCPFETGATSTAKPRLADAVVEPVERLQLFEMLPQRRRSIGRRARFEDRPQRATTRGETSATNPTSRRGGVNGSSPLRGLATSRSVVHFPAS